MKRILMMLALTALLVVALSMSALSAFAAPTQCGEPGAPGGCRTFDDPDKNNDKFTIQTTGNNPNNNNPHTCASNPSGKCK